MLCYVLLWTIILWQTLIREPFEKCISVRIKCRKKPHKNHINPNSSTMGSKKHNLVLLLIISTYNRVRIDAHLVHNEIKIIMPLITHGFWILICRRRFSPLDKTCGSLGQICIDLRSYTFIEKSFYFVARWWKQE